MRFHRIVAVVALMVSSLGATSDTPKVDHIVVYKHQRRMVLLSHGKQLKTYRVALGLEPVGAKRREGDHKTPEGTYVLDWRNDESKYYKSLHISYPSPEDLKRAEKAGVKPGGAIMLHGTPPEFAAPHGLPPYDWTEGCIAVTNPEMDEILKLVAVGTPIEIRP